MKYDKLNWEIKTQRDGDFLYLVFKSKCKQVQNLFPNGLKVSSYKYAFKDTYSDFKKEQVYTLAKKDTNKIIDFFLGVMEQIKETNTINFVSKYWDVNDTSDELISYLRFTGTDTERLGYRHGMYISEAKFSKNQESEFNQYMTDVNTYFDLTFNIK